MRHFTSLLALAAAGLFAPSVQAETLIGGGKTAPNFPIVISQSGSYKLAGNLNVPAGVDGIQVAAGLNVKIDLDGYTISGALNCGRTTACPQNGTMGIRAKASSVRIANGAVRGFAFGIAQDLPQQPDVAALALEDVTVMGNLYGVWAAGMLARNVVAQNNYLTGIQVNHGTLESCMAMFNGGTGIWVSGYGVLRNNHSKWNQMGFEIFQAVADGNSSIGNTQPSKLGSLVQGLNLFN